MFHRGLFMIWSFLSSGILSKKKKSGVASRISLEISSAIPAEFIPEWTSWHFLKKFSKKIFYEFLQGVLQFIQVFKVLKKRFSFLHFLNVFSYVQCSFSAGFLYTNSFRTRIRNYPQTSSKVSFQVFFQGFLQNILPQKIFSSFFPEFHQDIFLLFLKTNFLEINS